MRQRRLKYAAIPVATIAFGSLLTGCSAANTSGGSSSEELVVMSTFSPSDYAGPAYERAVKAFTEETGIKVKSVFSSATDIYTAYETSVLAGEEPDVLMANLYDKALTFTETGATIPVGDYLQKWGLDDTINPAAVDQWTDGEDRVQGFPFVGFKWPTWYNTDVLAQAGVTEVPTTTDELIDAATKLRAAGLQPFAIGGSDWSGEKLLLQIIQTTIPAEESEQLMAEGGYCDSDAAVAGIEEFVKLKDAGVFVDDAEGLTADNMLASFYEGKAAMMSTGSWAFDATPPDLAAKVTLAGFPLPADSTFTKPIAYEGYTANGIWLNKASEERIDDVEKFVKYMFSPEVITDFVSTGVVPTADGEDLDTVLASKPLLLSALTEVPEEVEYGVFPDFHVPGAKTQDLINATSAAFAPAATADSICAALDAVYN